MKLYEEGLRQLQAKNYTQAAQAFRDVLKSDPKHLDAKRHLLLALRSEIAESTDEKLWPTAKMQLSEAIVLALELLQEDKENAYQASLIAFQQQLGQVRFKLHQKQEGNAYPKPKTAASRMDNLVFQGGGIKGLAYLGALEQLMEHVDMNHVKRFGGTSAGAINALLLGLGYALDELKTMLQELDFKLFMDGHLREAVLDLSQRSEEVTQKVSGLFGQFKMIAQGSKAPLESSKASVTLPITASKLASNPDFKTIKEGLSQLTQNDFGLFDGDYFREGWVEPVIQAKTGITYATFKELHDQGYADMYFVGVNLATGRSEVFSYETTPHMVVSDAVRISMSIPFLFKPHHVYIKNNQGERIPDPNNNAWYVDGGLLDNYPLWLFDHPRYWQEGATTQLRAGNPYSLGFRIVSAERKAQYENNNNNNNAVPAMKQGKEENNPELVKDKPTRLGTFIWQVVETIYKKQESDHVKLHEQPRTIYIDHLGIKTTQFDLSNDDQQRLMKVGREAVGQYFLKHSQNALQATLKQLVEKGDATSLEAWLQTTLAPDNVSGVLDLALAQRNRPIIWSLLCHGLFHCTDPQPIRQLLSEARKNEWLDQKQVELTAQRFEAFHEKLKMGSDSAPVYSAALPTLKIA